MVKIIVVEKIEKSPGDYSRAKNPGTLHEYNYDSKGTIEVTPQEIADIRTGYLDSCIIDRIHEELGFYGGFVQLQIKKRGAKYGGWEVLWEGDV